MIGTAHFNTGTTAARIEAQVEDGPNGLVIRDAKDKLMLAHWHWDDLRPVDPLTAAPPAQLRLSCASDTAARLTLLDARQIVLARQRVPGLAPPPRRGWRALPGWLLWSGVAAGAALGCLLAYHGLAAAADRLAPLVPMRWEAKLGAPMVAGMTTKLGGRCVTPEGQAALDALVHKLTTAAALPFPVSATVVRNPMLNAFALPGGQIVVMSGLIAKVQSPDEVAGVLAHEMGHVVLRHVTRQFMQQAGLGLLALLVTGDATGGASVAAVTLITLSYSRQAEAEADAMGADLLHKANISARGFNMFFTRLEDEEKAHGIAPAFLSSHPATASRGHLPVYEQTQPALDEAQWQDLRRICGEKKP